VRDTLNKKKIDQLKVGEIIVAEGLEVRRTNSDLVFYAAKQVQGKRLRERLGSANEKMNLTKARKYLQQMVVLIPDAINSAIKIQILHFKRQVVIICQPLNSLVEKASSKKLNSSGCTLFHTSKS
jgi:hypothetical protein